MRDFGTIANLVRQSVSALTAGQDLGLQPNRDGKCVCNFHNDKRPSLKLYSGNRGYYCFVCGAHGDVIDLTAEVLHLRKTEALRWLNDQYGLNLPIDGNHDETVLKRARQTAELRAKELEYISTHTEALNRAVEDAYRVWMDWKSAVEGTRPTGQSEGITDEFAFCTWNAELAKQAYIDAQDELYKWNMDRLVHKGGDQNGSASRRRSGHDPVHGS